MKPGEPLSAGVRPCSVMTPVAGGGVGTRDMGYGGVGRSLVPHRGMGPGLPIPTVLGK